MEAATRPDGFHPDPSEQIEDRWLDRFEPLLAVTALTIGGLMLIDLDTDRIDSTSGQIMSTAVSLAIGITLLLAVRASGVPPRVRRVTEVVVGLLAATMAVALVVRLVADADLVGLSRHRPSPVWIPFAAVTPVAVVRRLVRHRRVTVNTLVGAIAAYLMIALGYAYTFLAVDALTDGPFLAPVTDSTTSFMYFSLVTITTLGYGDLAPTTDVGRLLATSEAILGQIYLVTVVAMLVGLFMEHRSRPDGPTVGEEA